MHRKEDSPQRTQSTQRERPRKRDKERVTTEHAESKEQSTQREGPTKRDKEKMEKI